MIVLLATQTVTYVSPSPLAPLVGLGALLALFLLVSWSVRGEPTPRATAHQTFGDVDPVDVHAEHAIAVCNGRTQLDLVKGHTR